MFDAINTNPILVQLRLQAALLLGLVLRLLPRGALLLGLFLRLLARQRNLTSYEYFPKGLSLVQWMFTGIVKWIVNGIVQGNFTFVVSGV